MAKDKSPAGWAVEGGVLTVDKARGNIETRRTWTSASQIAGDDDKVPYFEGTPIPSSLVLVILLAVAAASGSIGEALWWGEWRIGPWLLHPLVLLYALSGSLMISKTLRIPKP